MFLWKHLILNVVSRHGCTEKPAEGSLSTLAGAEGCFDCWELAEVDMSPWILTGASQRGNTAGTE